MRHQKRHTSFSPGSLSDDIPTYGQLQLFFPHLLLICGTEQIDRAFHANGSMLRNHQVSVKDRLTFFHAVVTRVACFAAGHRTIFKQELATLDVAHRKLLRHVVGPPAGMDWSSPWDEIS